MCIYVSKGGDKFELNYVFHVGKLIFSKNRTNILLKDKLLPDFCHGFFWSEENVNLNYFPTHDGVWVLVSLEFYLARC